MSDTLTGNLNSALGWTHTSGLPGASLVDESAINGSLTFSVGVSANQVDIVWYVKGTLAASSSISYTLSALTQTVFGSTITYALVKIRGLLIVNNGTNAGDTLQVDTSVTHGATALTGGSTGKITIGADGFYSAASPIDGFAISASSTDVLKLTNLSSSDSVNYEIAILGTSA